MGVSAYIDAIEEWAPRLLAAGCSLGDFNDSVSAISVSAGGDLVYVGLDDSSSLSP